MRGNMAIVEMKINSIRIAKMHNDSQVVILESKTEERYLAIWVGPTQADVIAIKLQQIGTTRPLTLDLLASVIQLFSGKVDSVVINDLIKDTFYAKIVLILGEQKFEVDCRPSDALALAVRTEAPIFVEEDVLKKAEVPVGWKQG
jgi:uncharacterized protein